MEIINKLETLSKAFSASIEFAKSGGNTTETIMSLREQLLLAKEAIFDIKQGALELKDENGDLKSQLAELKSFHVEKENYVFKALSTGSVVYILKSDVNAIKPSFYLCAHCFEKSVKSYLNLHEDNFHKDKFRCNACNETVQIPNDKKMTVGISSGSSRFNKDGW